MKDHNSKLLKVCVDLLFLQPRRNRGTETYVRELLKELERIPGLHLSILLNRSSRLELGDLRQTERCITCVSGLNRTWRVIYQQLMVPRIAQRMNADVLFCPGYLSPIYPLQPVVVTIHDTQFRKVPASISLGQRIIYDFVIPRAAKRAQGVITISGFSQREIQTEIGIRPDRINVIYIGPRRSPDITNLPDSKSRDFSHLKPYLLSVSSGLRHKNAVGLIEGFRRFRLKTGRTISLLLAGQSESDLALQGISPEAGVHAIGYVTDDELSKLYAQADGFILASLYEGFGMPILEAMQHRIPVACSDCASLPEVAGKAAIYFSPHDPDAIAQAMDQLTLDAIRRLDLIEAGTENLRRFSWERCARETLSVLRRAAGSGQPR